LFYNFLIQRTPLFLQPDRTADKVDALPCCPQFHIYKMLSGAATNGLVWAESRSKKIQVSQELRDWARNRLIEPTSSNFHHSASRGPFSDTAFLCGMHAFYDGDESKANISKVKFLNAHLMFMPVPFNGTTDHGSKNGHCSDGRLAGHIRKRSLSVVAQDKI